MLDWMKFIHQGGPYVMGQNHIEVAEHDRRIRANGWRMFSAQWLRNGGRVQQMLRHINENKKGDVHMCLAGTFDGGVYLPMALCAQTYWDNGEDSSELAKKVTGRAYISAN